MDPETSPSWIWFVCFLITFLNFAFPDCKYKNKQKPKIEEFLLICVGQTELGFDSCGEKIYEYILKFSHTHIQNIIETNIKYKKSLFTNDINIRKITKL